MKHIDGWLCPDILSGPGKFIKRAAVIPYALLSWHGPRRRAIQAGAHIGTFPRMLAQYFQTVTCVEPEPANWECLRYNIACTSRIHAWHGMLGDQGLPVAPLNVQPHGTGGHHATTRFDRDYVLVPQYAIDEWGYDDVDAIFLDTEGYELPVLHGAAQTLGRCHPLVVVEDNGCSQKYGIASGTVGQWLIQTFGYCEVGQYGEDRIFMPGRESLGVISMASCSE